MLHPVVRGDGKHWQLRCKLYATDEMSSGMVGGKNGLVAVENRSDSSLQIAEIHNAQITAVALGRDWNGDAVLASADAEGMIAVQNCASVGSESTKVSLLLCCPYRTPECQPSPCEKSGSKGNAFPWLECIDFEKL